MESNYNYSDKEIKELSKKHPDRAFQCDDGRVAHNGLIYKNEEELKRVLEIAMRSPISKVFLFFSKLFSRNKK